MLEARHASLYQRLHTAGLLDEVMCALIDGRNQKELAEELTAKGIPIKERALGALLRTHGGKWMQPPEKTEPRALYTRLKEAGLVDVVMSDLIEGRKDARTMARYLKTQGIDIQDRAVFDLLKTHGRTWRYEKYKDHQRAHGLPEDNDAAASEMLRRNVALLLFENDGLKETAALARMYADLKKTDQGERKTRVLEQREERAVLAAQMQGAAELDAILGEAEALRAAQEERQQSLRDKEPDTTRLEKLRRRMYGSAAILLDAKEGGSAA